MARLQSTQISVVLSILLTACATPSDQARLVQAWDAYHQHDYATALNIWQPLAEKGNAQAQTNLGVLYRHGEGVSKDDSEALKWYRRAAEQGNAEGEYNVGLIYDNGWGVSQDYAEALKWYRLSATQGNADSLANIGASYAGGDGVPKDYVQAYKWDSLAADHGNAVGAKNRDAIAPLMTEAQIAEAKKLATDWKLGQP